MKTQQEQDTVLQKVYQSILNNEKPLQIDPTIAANSFLLVFTKFSINCILIMIQKLST